MSLYVKSARVTFNQRATLLPKLGEKQDFKLDSEVSFTRLKGLLRKRIENLGIPLELALIENYPIENSGFGLDLIVKSSPKNFESTEAAILRIKTFPRGNYGQVQFIHWELDEDGEKEDVKKSINFGFLPNASMVTDVYLKGFLDTFSDEISKWV